MTSHILVREGITRQMKPYLSRQTEESGPQPQNEIDTEMDWLTDKNELSLDNSFMWSPSVCVGGS
jgi:hypothetical protein